MKPITTLFLHFVCSCIAYTQTNWQLFPQGQRTFWDTGSELKMHYCDSVVQVASGSRHLFGAKYFTKDIQNHCFDTILFLYSGGHDLPITEWSSDAGIWTKDLANNQKFSFYTQLGVGKSWDVPITSSDFDAIRFTCISVVLGNVLGVSDSLKIYRMEALLNQNIISHHLTGREFVLSRQYGLVKYSPIEQLVNATTQEYALAGMQIGTQKHGFTNDFLDYFGNYQAGQVFKHLTSYSEGGKTIDVISRDSIKQVQTNPDLVQVQFHSTRRFITSKYIGGAPPNVILQIDTFYRTIDSSYVYSRVDFPIFQYTPDWITLGPYHTKVGKIYKGMHDDWILPSEFVSYNLSDNGTICKQIFVEHFVGPIQYSTKYGLFIRDQVKTTGPRKYILLGVAGPTDTWGDTDRIVAINDPVLTHTEIKLTPNPAHDEIMLSLPEGYTGKSLRYRIFSMESVLLQEGTWNGPRIRIDQLAKGMHMMVITLDNGQQATAKFIKD